MVPQGDRTKGYDLRHVRPSSCVHASRGKALISSRSYKVFGSVLGAQHTKKRVAEAHVVGIILAALTESGHAWAISTSQRGMQQRFLEGPFSTWCGGAELPYVREKANSPAAVESWRAEQARFIIAERPSEDSSPVENLA
jgi:hypothetical protein